MACFFRRRIAAQLSRICGAHEDVLVPYLSALVSSKTHLIPGFCLKVNHLVKNGLLSPDTNMQTQTERLAEQVKKDDVVEEVITQTGVINFRINKLLLAEKLLEQLCTEPQAFGVKSEILQNLPKGRTLVEFSSPNIAKKFHAGHLRSTIIGNFIANLKQALGNDVVRINYLGDWGMQIGLLGAGFQTMGSQEKLQENALQHLYEVYVRVNRKASKNESVRLAAATFFRQLEQHDEQAMSLWKQFREITVKEYKKMYARLGVHFDQYSGESFHQSRTREVLKDLQTQCLLKTRKGTGVVDLSAEGDLSSYATVVRSDGTSLYITRDVAAALERKERFNFDEMIYVTDKSQSQHFQHLFQLLKLMGHHWADRCVHVPFGLVAGMSSRLGEVVLLEDVLNKARDRMLQNMKEATTSKELADPELTADQIGISAVIIEDFKGSLISDYKFDWDKFLQATGDTGVLLQYTHARLRSLLRMNESESHTQFNPSHLQDNKSLSVLQHLLKYDEVLLKSSLHLEPRHLVNYLIVLSHLASSAHKELVVKGSPVEVAQARLCLFSCTCSVLANGMKILGIKPVEKM